VIRRFAAAGAVACALAAVAGTAEADPSVCLSTQVHDPPVRLDAYAEIHLFGIRSCVPSTTPRPPTTTPPPSIPPPTTPPPSTTVPPTAQPVPPPVTSPPPSRPVPTAFSVGPPVSQRVTASFPVVLPGTALSGGIAVPSETAPAPSWVRLRPVEATADPMVARGARRERLRRWSTVVIVFILASSVMSTVARRRI
jgi:hypothetical protein